MFKKLSTTTLIIILVVLAGLVALNKFYFSKKSEKTFNDEFVSIDTSMVNEIYIYPKAENRKEIKITRQARGWDLQYGQVKTIADSAAVRNLIAAFASIKSNALGGADQSSWAELQIDDTSGSRIKFVTSDNKTYDMVVGKFGFNASSRSGVTYIRHADEEAVYAIDGFLALSVNQPYSGWRNKTFINGNKDNWTTLTFAYPGDSSFVLSKQDQQWMINGRPADSSKTTQYLSALSAMQNSEFVDSYTPVTTPLYTLTIQGNNLPQPLKVSAYQADSLQRFILHSSLNPDAFFSDGQSRLAERIFVGGENFRSE